MSKLRSLKLFVQQRLTAAVHDILGHLEETIRDYEEELGRRRPDLLDVVLIPEVKQREAVSPRDVQQLLVSEEEPPHFKEEEEERWSGEEGEQLQGLEEADTTRFPFTAAPVKSDDDDEKPESSQRTQSPTEDNRDTEPLTSSSAHCMETEDDGENCGGPQTDRNSHPHTQLGSGTDDKGPHSSETEIRDDEGQRSECSSLELAVVVVIQLKNVPKL
ncbi:hypothetical protein Q5P01_018891 [Channa striata]|uniref:Uncharacterized protein n=1 Tax=Channa striata TaxID=64152 RepID=A0AA88S8X6_CHASR|nr:hypothetical protein Q5P01_018891 [Channa striata]